jgi:hypothetical protein
MTHDSIKYVNQITWYAIDDMIHDWTWGKCSVMKRNVADQNFSLTYISIYIYIYIQWYIYKPMLPLKRDVLATPTLPLKTRALKLYHKVLVSSISNGFPCCKVCSVPLVSFFFSQHLLTSVCRSWHILRILAPVSGCSTQHSAPRRVLLFPHVGHLIIVLPTFLLPTLWWRNAPLSFHLLISLLF